MAVCLSCGGVYTRGRKFNQIWTFRIRMWVQTIQKLTIEVGGTINAEHHIQCGGTINAEHYIQCGGYNQC